MERRRGFTLLELLVVITIISIGSLLLVPAFGRILQSLAYTGSVNTVTATLATARTIAVRENRHTAVAFLWDDEREIMSLQILVELSGIGASLSPFTGTGSTTDNYAFAYRPAAGRTPVELPPGAAVFGLSLSVEPAGSQIDSATAHWYAGEFVTNDAGARESVWLFPRNDPAWYSEESPVDRDTRLRGIDAWDDLLGDGLLTQQQFIRATRHAATFCIQFAPDGSVVNSPSAGGVSTVNAYIEFPDGPLNRATRRTYDSDVLFDPETGFDEAGGFGEPDPNREVVMRSAFQLAIVDLSELADGIGVERPWRIQSPEGTTPKPSWIFNSPYNSNESLLLLNEWIDQNGEIISFNRYTGELMRRTQL